MLLKHPIFLTAVFALSTAFCHQTFAEGRPCVQDLRNWVANVIRGDEVKTTEPLATREGTDKTVSAVFETFTQKIQGLFGQASQLIDQRIGWLRPTNAKEVALIWMAVTFALPWAFVGWLRPILKHDLRPVRWIVVGLWTSLALWMAWTTWGVTSGGDRFASTMLIGLPMLLMYFSVVAASVRQPVKR